MANKNTQAIKDVKAAMVTHNANVAGADANAPKVATAAYVAAVEVAAKAAEAAQAYIDSGTKEAPAVLVKQAPGGHTAALVYVAGELVSLYPIALSGGRFYFSINASAMPLLAALATHAYTNGVNGPLDSTDNAVMQAHVMDVLSTTLSVQAPVKKGRKSTAIDWTLAKKLA